MVAHAQELLAFAVPVLVLVLPLLAGRYPGEKRIERALRRGRPRRARPQVVVAPLAWLRRPREIVRGGRLIATSLAVRPPPPAVAP